MLLFLTGLNKPQAAAPPTEPEPETSVMATDNIAWTWFGRPNTATYNGKAWIGTTKDIAGGTTQHVTEYNAATDIFNTVQVGTVWQKDDHNQTQLLVRSSDKRLLAVYVEHNGAAIRYRLSTNPESAATWGPETAINPASSIYSYSSPYEASNGDIYIIYRRRNPTAWEYIKSTDGGVTFGGRVQFWNGGGNNYLISAQSDTNKDLLHFTVTYGHPQSDPTIANSVYHCYFNMATQTFHKSDGTDITSLLVLAPSEVTPVYVPASPDSSWIIDITTKAGKPRILYVKYPNGINDGWLNKDIYFTEWTGSAWTAGALLGRILSGYMDSDATVQEKAYTPSPRFDVVNPDCIWWPEKVNGILEMHRAVWNGSGITKTQLTFNSTVDNWRPVSTGLAKKNLLWLRKNDYQYYITYDMDLMALTANRGNAN